MTSKEEAIATARTLLEQLKESARTEQSRQEFSRIMGSAFKVASMIDHLETGTLRVLSSDDLQDLHAISFSGVDTSTMGDIVPEVRLDPAEIAELERQAFRTDAIDVSDIPLDTTAYINVDDSGV